jgi:hypothetical protein
VEEILGFCFSAMESVVVCREAEENENSPRHSVWNRAENSLHHRQMFAIVVRLEERNSKVELEHDASDGP